MWYVLSALGGVVLTVIVEVILIYIFGRRAANKKNVKV